MKICLYLEYYHFHKGIIFNKMGTGIRSSYLNQKTALHNLGIEYVEKWDDSCDILQINMLPLPIKTFYLIKKAKHKGKKVVIWSHTTVEDTQQLFKYVPFLTPIFKKYLTTIYRSADLIFSPSEYTKMILIAYGIPEAKIIVQSNGVDLKKHFLNKKISLSGKTKYNLGKFAIGTVGLVMPRKGLDTFVDLAKKNQRFDFAWFGKILNISGRVKPLLKNLPDNVRFTGYVDDVNEAYNSLDIFIFPSYEENEGMSILEAAAIGLPILVRDIPVYEGWLINGENCLKAKNDNEFEHHLNRLINDSTLRTRLSRGAKKIAEEKSIELISQKTLMMYKKLLSVTSLTS